MFFFRFTKIYQIVLKFKTCKTCVLPFRTICANLRKSDKIICYVLDKLGTKFVDVKEQPVPN